MRQGRNRFVKGCGRKLCLLVFGNVIVRIKECRRNHKKLISLWLKRLLKRFAKLVKNKDQRTREWC